MSYTKSSAGYDVDLEEFERQPKRAIHRQRRQSQQSQQSQRPLQGQRRPTVERGLSSREGMPASTVRYQDQAPYNSRVQAPVVDTQRSRALQQQRTTTKSARSAKQAQARRDPDTYDDTAIRKIDTVKWADGSEDEIVYEEATEALVLVESPQTPTRNRQQRRQGRFHPLVYVGVSFILLLLLYVGWVNAACWYSNMIDPSAHAITTHMAIKDSHQYHLQAFIDEEGHLDLLAVPNGNWQKAQVFIGPNVSGFNNGNPQNAWIEIDDHSRPGKIIIKLLGPYDPNHTKLQPVRGLEQDWTLTVDAHGLLKQGGGK